FNTDGFVVLESVLDEGTLAQCRAEAMSNFRACRAVVNAKGLDLGKGCKTGFAEIVQRNHGRFEMAFGMDEGVFATDAVRRNPRIDAVVGGALGSGDGGWTLHKTTLIVATGGAAEQAWHADGGHISLEKHLPAHCLSVFLPLVDLSAELGPTEFRPGSQVYTRDLARLLLAAKARRQLQPPQAPLPRAGDALLFDFRVLHRGRANATAADRPVLVLVYAKPWFRDVVNWPKRSLADAE
ncbi:unnamed protein product, partial [Phaeothamnion confervicola]